GFPKDEGIFRTLFYGNRYLIVTGVVDCDTVRPQIATRGGEIVLAGTQRSLYYTFDPEGGEYFEFRPSVPALARYDANGSPDLGFGGGFVADLGAIFSGADASFSNDFVNSAAIQPDGKVLVGTGSSIARFSTDGTLDSPFSNAFLDVWDDLDEAGEA